MKFAKHKDCSGGVRNICTTCEGRLAYANHRKSQIAAVRRYQKAHPEEHRERKRAADRVRHGRVSAGAGVSVAEYREIMSMFGGICAYCRTGKAETMDHVMPLSRGGKHEASNLLPACKACNFEKHNKTLDEWAQAARH